MPKRPPLTVGQVLSWIESHRRRGAMAHRRLRYGTRRFRWELAGAW